jgi:outer membrane protein assembly factor BamB
MVHETLEDHVRRATRGFTARLTEDEVFALAHDLANGLARAHAETPPRHPELEPSRVHMAEGHPRLEGQRSDGAVGDDLLRLGALMHWLATGRDPELALLLDGADQPEMASIARRAVFAGLVSPHVDERYATARAAAEAIAAALRPASDPPVWPLFRGDPGRSGARAAAKQPATLVSLWEAPLGPVVGAPALTRQLVIAPLLDGRLAFLDRATGRRLHEARLGAALESSPALSEGLVVVGTDGGEVVALDLFTGREAWRSTVGRMVRSSALLVGERVLVGAVDGRSAGALVALDARSGKALWRRALRAVFSSPALGEGAVLVGSDDGSLHAFDPETGNARWSHRLGGRVRATPAVAAGAVVVADFEGRVASLRLSDHSPLWSRALGQPVYASAAVSSDLAVVGAHDGLLRAFRLADGEPAFEVSTRGPIVSSPLLLGKRVLVASTDGDLYLIDLEGRTLARLTLAREGTQSSPAVDGDCLYIGSARGVHAVRLEP